MLSRQPAELFLVYKLCVAEIFPESAHFASYFALYRICVGFPSVFFGMNEHLVIEDAVVLYVRSRPDMVDIVFVCSNGGNIKGLAAICAFRHLTEIQEQRFALQFSVCLIAQVVKLFPGSYRVLQVELAVKLTQSLASVQLVRINAFVLTARHFNKYFLRWALFCFDNVCYYVKRAHDRTLDGVRYAKLVQPFDKSCWMLGEILFADFGDSVFETVFLPLDNLHQIVICVPHKVHNGADLARFRASRLNTVEKFAGESAEIVIFPLRYIFYIIIGKFFSVFLRPFQKPFFKPCSVLRTGDSFNYAVDVLCRKSSGSKEPAKIDIGLV